MYSEYGNRKQELNSFDGIIYISRSLDIDYMERDIVDTSSKIFEDGLVKAMSKKRSVSVLYLGCKNIEKYRKNNIDFYSINYRSIFGGFRLLHFLNNSKYNNSKIITSGYNLNLNLVLIFSRILGYSIFSYVYDTHKIATRKKNIFKKLILNLYFSLGFLCLRFFNGILVINDIFLKKNRFIGSFILTKIGYSNIDSLDNRKLTSNKKTKIIFAGTINNENGISIILNYLKGNRNDKVEFVFYGTGNEIPKLIEYMKNDNRVKYKGSVPINELSQALSKADYLINLRDPNSIACSYSFPSKLIQFMGSGVPVISNSFPGLSNSYKKYLINVRGFSGEELNEVLSNLPSRDESIKLGSSSKEFILKNNNWDNIVIDLIEYIESS
ncbi:glycosyltransferase [Psychrobacter immobilis]|uniref:glycosyltransferase n=1 Tax=Psychrobacter immobilis TaxID=498 RepID=UPI001919EDC2|nr:glycosyltransferase [Psychrobacter immobilis]